jgi:FkbM family methyltransferase
MRTSFWDKSLRGYAEKKAVKAFHAIPLSPEDIAIDCGANVGKITGYLGQNGSTVYAFEPNKDAFRELTSRFRNNAKVYCINKGVSTHNGTTRLFLHKNAAENPVRWSTGSSIIQEKGNVDPDNYEEIELVDLAEFIRTLNRKVKLLKIDIEGAECDLLRKMILDNTIALVEHIFVETHDHKIPELKEATDEIRKLIRLRHIKHINLDWT